MRSGTSRAIVTRSAFANSAMSRVTWEPLVDPSVSVTQTTAECPSAQSSSRLRRRRNARIAEYASATA
ncbi:hypothetical protein StrepF001_13330 [Streptomyces sp. F001]|nr:hypothetical protein StrepF001_13330 [Streptomyces sp. F001]